jgi:hypothetical protein
LIGQVPLPGRCWRSSAAVLVGDGEREWAVYADRVVVRRYGGCWLADRLLDPSWLMSRYDLAVTGDAPVGGRPAVGIAGRRKAVRRSNDGVPEAMEALADAERGFLHTFTGMEGDAAVETMALQDPHRGAIIDDATFRVELRQGVRVQDRTWDRRHHLMDRLGSWGRPTRV